MPTLSLTSKYEINNSLIISPEELRDVYLFGTPLKDRSGKELTNRDIQFHIKAATDGLEQFLSLKLTKQVIQENFQFNDTDWKQWGYVRTTYPVVCPLSLIGMLNTTKQITYDKQWLTSKKTNDGLYHRHFSVVPAGNTTSATMAYVFSGLLPNFGFMNQGRIPDYWMVEYVTGFDKVPENLIQIVGTLAAVNVLRITSDLVLNPGVGSFSLSIDGLSQSVNAKGYDARIKGYIDDLTSRLLPQAKDYYKGFLLSVA